MNQNCEDKFKNSEDSGKNALENDSSWLKANSVEGSAPGECCVPRGEEMVALELLGFFPLCPPVYFFIALKDRYSNDW